MNNYTLDEVKVNYAFSDDSFIADNLFFLPKSLPVKDYHIDILKRWNITDIKSEGTLSAITIKQSLPDENDSLLEEAALEDNEGAVDVEIEKSLITDQDIEALAIDDKSVQGKTASDAPLKDTVLSSKSFLDVYKYWIKETVKIFKNFLIEKDVDKERVKNFVEDIIRITSKNRNNALMLFGRKFESVLYVFTQTIETVILANIIAESRKLSALATSNLALATFFHDFGMLKIPLSLLEKTEKLTANEMAIIQNHTIIGYKYLRDARYSAIIASGALQHHERLDGKGYPYKITGDKITEIAKIISVVDAYCAAIASKPFRESPQHAKIVLQELLSKGGTAYDASILRELIKNISLYPIGSMVLLSNDKIAVVVGVSKAAMRPKVKVLQDGKEGELIDLSEREDIFIKSLYKSQK